MNMMFEPLRKYAQFDGRARRQEFWMFWLFTFVVSIVFQVLLGAIGGAAMSTPGAMPMPGAPMPMPGAAPSGGVMILLGLFLLFGLAILIPSLAVAFRRLHDTNRSAWWLLIALIPFIGAIVLIVFYLLDGTPGPNKFGPDPKGRDLATTFS